MNYHHRCFKQINVYYLESPSLIIAPRPSTLIHLFPHSLPPFLQDSLVSTSLWVCPLCSLPLYCFLASTIFQHLWSCLPCASFHIDSTLLPPFPKAAGILRWLSILDSDWGVRELRGEFESSTEKRVRKMYITVARANCSLPSVEFHANCWNNNVFFFPSEKIIWIVELKKHMVVLITHAYSGWWGCQHFWILSPSLGSVRRN